LKCQRLLPFVVKGNGVFEFQNLLEQNDSKRKENQVVIRVLNFCGGHANIQHMPCAILITPSFFLVHVIIFAK